MLPLVALNAGACTGGDATQTPTSPASSSAGPATSNAPVRFKPGEYVYAFGYITASLSLQGSDGTLKVLNQTDDTVGAPSVYVITGDDRRFNGRITGAAPIPKAADATLQVTFPPQVTEKTVGLVVLVLGSDTIGAMAPAPAT